MPALHLDAAIPLPALLILAIASLAIAVWYYRTAALSAGPARRTLLVLLRGSALFLLFLILARVEIRFSHSSTDLPRLAILLDNSASLRTADAGGVRGTALNAFLRSGAAESIARRADVRFYTFGVNLHPFAASGADTLNFTEEATDIAGALRSLEHLPAREKPDAALLLTDGTFTLGQNPVYDAEKSALPLFTVLLGDSVEQRDLVLTRVLSNSTVFSGLPTPVEVRVRSNGFSSGQTTVRVLRGSEELARRTLQIEPGNREYTVSLSYTPVGEGLQRLTVLLDAIRGESTPANNRRFFSAEVLRSRLRLLLMAGGPTPDIAALRQALAGEPNFDIRPFTQKRGGGFYEGTLTRATVDSADCLVLIGFPSSSTSEQTLSWVTGALDRGVPFFFLAGRHLDYGRLRSLGSWLPFTADLSSTVEIAAVPQPAPAAGQHPLLAGEHSSTAAAWTRLPPLFRTLTVFRPKAEATILLFSSVDGVSSSDPFLLVRSAGGQRSVALLSYGVYRWMLMTAGDPITGTVFTDFLRSSIRWLTSPPDVRRLRVRPTRDLLVEGEAVEFEGEAYDATGVPMDNARITLTVRLPDRTLEAELIPAGNGRYGGRVEGLPAGEYSYSALGEAGAAPLGQVRGKFTVGEPALEFLDTRSSPALLRDLASHTGGRYLGPLSEADFDTLLFSHQVLRPRPVDRSRLFQVWTLSGILAAVIVLLATEWFLRRRSGLL
jgi:hypothetical protein